MGRNHTLCISGKGLCVTIAHVCMACTLPGNVTYICSDPVIMILVNLTPLICPMSRIIQKVTAKAPMTCVGYNICMYQNALSVTQKMTIV
jgi:hypothetical protein